MNHMSLDQVLLATAIGSYTLAAIALFAYFLSREAWLRNFGAPLAILISSSFFMVVHLTKSWAMVGMVPIVFGAGILLGILAWSSGSLLPGMIGHVLMDIGMFAYWWTGIAGDFTARPIAETGVDGPFLIACAAFAMSLLVTLFAISKLRRPQKREELATVV